VQEYGMDLSRHLPGIRKTDLKAPTPTNTMVEKPRNFRCIQVGSSTKTDKHLATSLLMRKTLTGKSLLAFGKVGVSPIFSCLVAVTPVFCSYDVGDPPGIGGS
uniref:Uncharacterized protein n=1 Tax=Naja naja TaxID=35670 RepID=A0A8C6XJ01_NAJNA